MNPAMSLEMEAAAQHVRERCLFQQDSLFFQGSAVWTPANLKRLRTVFLEQPDESKRTFWEKYQDQLANEDREVILLGAEVLAVYYLYPLNVLGDTKRDRVNQVLRWAGDELPEDNPITRAFWHGIINAGQGYNAHRPWEMGFLIDFMLAGMSQRRRTARRCWTGIRGSSRTSWIRWTMQGPRRCVTSCWRCSTQTTSSRSRVQATSGHSSLPSGGCSPISSAPGGFSHIGP